MPGDAVYTALITGGTAVFTGFISSVATRSQHAVERRRLQHEYAAGTSNQVQFRQDLYLRYLAAYDALRLARTREPPYTVTFRQYVALYDEARDLDDQVEIFATDTVAVAREACWDAVDTFYGRIVDLMAEANDADGSDADDPDVPDPDDSESELSLAAEAKLDVFFTACFSTALDESFEDIVTARRELITAMRRDVGPTSK